MRQPRPSILRALGPGVLFTGAAVGVSHLVQSTRAGAVYGLALVGLVLLANLTKYPAFRFGPLYATATGTSLLEGYRRQGKWALVLYAILTLGTMFTVQAAVTVVTAGLAKVLFGLDVSPAWLSAGLLALCAGLVASGGYRALDGVGKVVVSLLAISTLVATALVLPRVEWGTLSLVPDVGLADVAFLAALVGWMPSAIDVSVWQSIWTLARREQTGHAPSSRESSFDFHLGYLGTAVLALCFVILGSAVLHGSGVEVEDRPGAFAAQLISLYTESLGEWARPLIGAAAFATMFSTTLTVVDGFPRALSVLIDRFQRPEQEEPAGRRSDRTPAYWVSLAAITLGALTILAFLASSMRTLIDLATTLSFLSAPLLSLLNHRAVTSEEVTKEHRPKGWLIGASLVCIAFQALFALFFLWTLTR
ncbi:MAG TPA: permease [Myxococcales bacterium]|nr:permease [Myxococcales bacterium]